MIAFGHQAAWRLADLEKLCSDMARKMKTQNPEAWELLEKARLSGLPQENASGSSDAWLRRSFSRPWREASAVATLERASHGICYDIEVTFSITPGSPESMAMSWRELDERERLLAQAMDPCMLVEWLANSFERPDPHWGQLGPSIDADSHTVLQARACSVEGQAERRALRAYGLAYMLLCVNQWRESFGKAAKQMAQSAKKEEGKSIQSGLAMVARSMGWERTCFTGMMTGVALGAGGGLAQNIPVMTGQLGAAGAAGASFLGFALLCTSAISLVRKRNAHENLLAKNVKKWGQAGAELMWSVYPEFGEKGVFAEWGDVGGYEGLAQENKQLHQGFSKALGAPASLLSEPCAAPIDLEWIAPAMQALYERDMIAGMVEPLPKGVGVLKKRAKAL